MHSNSVRHLGRQAGQVEKHTALLHCYAHSPPFPHITDSQPQTYTQHASVHTTHRDTQRTPSTSWPSVRPCQGCPEMTAASAHPG